MMRATRRWLKAQTWFVVFVLVASAIATPAAQSAAPVVTDYYHVDAGGSIRVVTNDAGGIDRTYDYGPFGELETSQCSQSPDARLYTGQERDRETCLDYFGARYYRSTAGRFLSMDPVVDQDKALLDPQQWNRYVYARNNPTRFIDPDGRIIGTMIDLYSLYWSAVYVYRDPAQAQHWGTLILDVFGVFMPFLPAPGLAVRTVQAIRAQRAVEAARQAATAAEQATKAAADVSGAVKQVDKITGYTKHGIDRAVSRDGGQGVHPSAILDAVKNPQKTIEQSNGTTKYVGSNATVVLNQQGKVVTTWGQPRSRK